MEKYGNIALPYFSRRGELYFDLRSLPLALLCHP